MTSDQPAVPTETSGDMIHHEKRARRWNILVTVLLTAVLFVPMPFVRFDTWPGNEMLAEHIVTPWSRFRLCYESLPCRDPVVDVYRFSWKGRLKNGDGTNPQFLHPGSLGPASLKWQNGPEITLREAYVHGELIRVETYWQPMILWPFKMIWRIREHFKVPVRA
ncbi:MAG: hypothetical protein MUC41_12715 [Syntrophobacteraceae bacterium]|nr:hypothetical protein [Syntrophobacteraceae bacterium]